MADEIWINTGETTQQPYQGQAPAGSQVPEVRQTTYTVPASAQSPFTYNNRTPFTYRSPVVGREPNIRNAQQPFTYTRQGQQPSTYTHRSPYSYNNSTSKQSPFTYQHRSPSTYNFRSPSTYNHRSPSTYNHRSPFTYRNPVAHQNPFIRNAQQPYPYIAAGQEPNIRNIQEPNIRNNQEPNIRSGQEPNERSRQTPFTYQHRSPFTYNHRSSYDYQHRSPFPYTHRNPTPYTYQQPNIVQGQGRTPVTYSNQGRSPFIYNASYDVSTPAIAKSEWDGSSFEDSAFAEAELTVIVYYNGAASGDPIIVQVKADGDSGNTQNSALAVPSSWTQYYNVHDTLTDHDDSPYTVKYTMTNVTVDTGTLNPDNNMTLTTSATNVPTGPGPTALFWYYKCVSEADEGSDGDDEELNCDLNLIFEHSVLETFTFTLNIDEMFAKSSAS